MTTPLFNIRLNDDDKEFLLAAASSVGQKLSPFIRNAALERARDLQGKGTPVAGASGVLDTTIKTETPQEALSSPTGKQAIPSPAALPQEFLTGADVVMRCKISERTLYDWRVKKGLKAHQRSGGGYFYEWADVVQFIRDGRG